MKGGKVARACEMLKKRLQDAGSESVFIETENGEERLVYKLESGRVYQVDISRPSSATLGELGRALVAINLLKRGANLQVEQISEIGSPSKRVDLVLGLRDVYEDGEQRRAAIALVEVKTSLKQKSNKKFASFVKRQLLNIAHSYANSSDKPFPLVLIAAEIFFNETISQIIEEYTWFFYKDIITLQKTRQLTNEGLLGRDSPIAHHELPEDLTSFAWRPLQCGDLIEISNVNAFKKLLKEHIHQIFRKYGITGNDAFKAIMDLLLAKVYDELKAHTPLKFQVQPRDLLDPDSFLNRIRELLENARVELLRMDARDAEQAGFSISAGIQKKLLLEVVPYLQRFRIRSIRMLQDDAIGDVFLDFMHNLFRQERGMFFTHPNICKFVVEAVGIDDSVVKAKNKKYILDPSCGSGTFLVEAMRAVFRNEKDIEKIKSEAMKVIYGADVNRLLVELAKINMALHGDGSGNIHVGDMLRPLESLPFPNVEGNVIKDKEFVTPEFIRPGRGFDFVITNPPFSLELQLSNLGHFKIKDFVISRGDTTRCSECVFTERWFQLLNPGGRVGVVLPISLFDSPEYFNARKMLISFFRPVALVILPEHCFAPFAAQRTVLFFGVRRDNEEALEIFNKLFSQEEPKVEEEALVFVVHHVGFYRQKRKGSVETHLVDDNDLTPERSGVIRKAFENFSEIVDKVDGTGFRKIGIDKILEGAILSSYIISSCSKRLTLEKDWDIVTPEDVGRESDGGGDFIICETGDKNISSGTGVILPMQLSAVARMTTVTNYYRLCKKLQSRKFGKLRKGDIIIAPARPYQAKIAIVTESSEAFLYSKDFIVLRQKGEVDLERSVEVLLVLLHPDNVALLRSIAVTGKKGYEKIVHPRKILKLSFCKPDIPSNLSEIYDAYDHFYKTIIQTFFQTSNEKNKNE